MKYIVCFSLALIASAAGFFAWHLKSMPAAEVFVANSGVKEVDAAVAMLVSRKPAPLRTGDHSERIEDFPDGFATREVADARLKISALAYEQLPALLVHLDDDRYSYSYISAAWYNETVGGTIMGILESELGVPLMQKAGVRECENGLFKQPRLQDYLHLIELSDWPRFIKSKNQREFRRDFIRWCVDREREAGFKDRKQELYVLRYYQEAERR